jgi:hypothetical protein
MRKAGLVSLLAIGLTALAPDPPSKSKTHGYALSGTIAGIDEAHKTFVVKNEAGKNWTLFWTAATTFAGGKLKTGEKVTLRYLDKDKKHIATSVSVGEQVARTPSPANTPAAR